MPIAQKLPIAARTALALSWCLVAVAGCSHGRPSVTPTEVPTGTALWLQDPCASDSIDEFGWTLYNLRDITVRVPRDFQRLGKWNPDLLSFRRGSATLTLSLSRDSWYGLQNSIRAKPRLRTCYGEIAGYVANVATYYVDGYYTYIVYWDHRWEVNGIGKWLLGVVRARDAGDANRLRQALLTVRLPLESGSWLKTQCEHEVRTRSASTKFAPRSTCTKYVHEVRARSTCTKYVHEVRTSKVEHAVRARSSST